MEAVVTRGRDTLGARRTPHVVGGVGHPALRPSPRVRALHRATLAAFVILTGARAAADDSLLDAAQAVPVSVRPVYGTVVETQGDGLAPVAEPEPARLDAEPAADPAPSPDPAADAAQPQAVRLGNLVVHDTVTTISAYDLAAGHIRWRFSAGGAPLTQVQTLPDDTLVVAAGDLLALRPADGSRSLRYALGCQPDGSCNLRLAHIDERRAVLAGIGARPDAILPIDVATGAELWPAWVTVGPVERVFADERWILVTTTNPSELVAVAPGLGRLRWRVPAAVPDPRVGSLAVREAWSDADAVYVWRADSRGGGPSRVDTLDPESGAVKSTLPLPACPSTVERCGIVPLSGAAVFAYALAPGPALPAPAAAPGGMPVLTTLPVRVGTDRVAFALRDGAGLTVQALDRATGRIVWRRPLAGSGEHVTLAAFGADVAAAWPGFGGGLTLVVLAGRDGRTQAVGQLPGAAPVAGLFGSQTGLVVVRGGQATPLVFRPAGEFVAAYLAAVRSGNDAEAARIAEGLLPFASELTTARRVLAIRAEAEVRRARRELAAGRAAAAFDGLKTLCAQADATAGGLAALVIAASAFNNLLASGVPSAAGEPLSRLARRYGEALRGLAPALAAGGEAARLPLQAAGLQLLDALAGAGRLADARGLLDTLQGLPLGLDPHALPAVARRLVATLALERADEAAQRQRSEGAVGAAEALGAALDLPLVAAVLPTTNGLRSEIEQFRRQPEAYAKNDVRALVKRAAAAFRAVAQVGVQDPLDCHEACARKAATCEGPCATQAACNNAMDGCVAACEQSNRPLWRAPDDVAPAGPDCP